MTPAQSSAVPGRQMSDTLRVMRAVFEAVEAGEWGGSLVQMDQSKAFDRVHRPYLWAVMRQRGVPKTFVRWLGRLYAHAHVRPALRDRLGPKIPQARGLRQGCPLSPILYALALDPFLERVQADVGRMRGVVLGDGEGQDRRVVVVAHADDAIFLVSQEQNHQEMRKLQSQMTYYARVSGAAVNVDKSVVYRLPRGGHSAADGEMGMTVTTLREQEGGQARDATQEDKREQHLRILGIWYGVHPKAWRHNWLLWRDKAIQRIKLWTDWGLGVYQRAAYVNQYLVPEANFLAKIYPPPVDLVQEVEKKVRGFILYTTHFPLHPVETHWPVEGGGLGCKALTPWLTATYMAANFHPWWERVGRRRAQEEGEEQQQQQQQQQQHHKAGPSGPQDQHRERNDASWAAFGVRWANSRWAEKWWWQSEVGRQALTFRLTQALRAELPDPLQELARAVQQTGLSAQPCKEGSPHHARTPPEDALHPARTPPCTHSTASTTQAGTHTSTCKNTDTTAGNLARPPGSLKSLQTPEQKAERSLRQALYGQALQRMDAQAHAGRLARWQGTQNTRQKHVSAYKQRGRPAAQEAFGPQEGQAGGKDTTPFRMRETRWRAFHQVLNTGEANPWRAAQERSCPRCRYLHPPGSTQAGNIQDTQAHYAMGCPEARGLWDAVARELRWPALARQHWETVVSGLRPRPGEPTLPGNRQAVDAGKHPPDTNRGAPLPWDVVRLVNLAVLSTRWLQRDACLREAERRGEGGREGGLRGRTAARVRPWRRTQASTSHDQNTPATAEHRQPFWGGRPERQRLNLPGPEVFAPRVKDLLNMISKAEMACKRRGVALSQPQWQRRWGWLRALHPT